MTQPVGRLGKLPPRHDPRTLLAARYLTPAITPPAQLDLTTGITGWPMYANDAYGDCTIAALAHQIEIYTEQTAGTVKVFSDTEILAMYGLVNGGSDNGAVELDVLRCWRDTGLAGDRIYAFCAVNHPDLAEVRAACFAFSGLYLGIALPLSAQSQAVWDAAPGPSGAPGSWGGHAVNVVAYDPNGLTVVTWGRLQVMTWAFWRKYVDECWCVLPVEYETWTVTHPNAQGLDFDQLRADLAVVGTLPDPLPPGPGPTPPAPPGCNPFGR